MSNEYVTEEDLRFEINNIQKSVRLGNLEKWINDPDIFETTDHSKDKNLSKLHIVPLTLEDAINERTNLLNDGAVLNYSKGTFGIMILKIVQRLATKSNFGGYTENWKTDFYSNALEKILLYAINNIDLDMISPRTQKPVKIFAYITQIANNAFLEIINERKEEQENMMEKIIPFEDFYDHVKKYYAPNRTYITEKEKPDIVIECIPINNEINIQESQNSYQYVDNNGNKGTFVSVYDTLNEYKETKKIQITYPEEYSMSMDEFNKIKSMGFEFLNVHKRQKDVYKPSFPKKQKKEKLDPFNEWD